MILDSKGKLFGKISIVDILIVVIIVAAIGGLYYKFGRSGTVTPFTKTDKIQMTLFAEDVPEYVANAVKAGDIVKDRVQNVTIGKVTDVKVGPDIFFTFDSTGKSIASSKPGYNSLAVVVQGTGIYSPTGATFGGVEYYYSKQVDWRIGITDMFARVSNITK